MKCKNWSNKINNFVVRKLKSFKINGQQTLSTMPAMPKEKMSPVSLNDSNFVEMKMKDQLEATLVVSQFMVVTTSADEILSGTVASSTGTTNCSLNLMKSISSNSSTNNTTSQMTAKHNCCNHIANKINCGTSMSSRMMMTPESSNQISYSLDNDTVSSTSSSPPSPSNTATTTATILNGATSLDATKRATTPPKKSAKDYVFGKFIGDGSFSTVYLARDVHTNKEYAIKVCDKKHILREKKQEYVRREREVMHIMSNVPGFVNLSCTFQDYRSLYFVMTYAKNGDLLPYINKVGSFDLDCTRHYAAELVLAIEQMHKRNVVHRDLKPENILLDENMHTLIADFGSSKILNADKMTTTVLSKKEAECNNEMKQMKKRKGSFVGTAQYVSPEVLQGNEVSRAADLWALGCIMYQMISGLPPFRGGSDYLIFKEIMNLNLVFPEGFDKNAEDLVRNLLKLNPEERMGAQDKLGRYESIRTHSFFEGINWDTVRQQPTPPIYPYLPGLSIEDELRSHYRVPDNLEPGLDDKQLKRLFGLELGIGEELEKKTEAQNNFDLCASEKQKLLEAQKSDKWAAFSEDEVILKKGFVNKRKGLFARKRMLLLTTGPRLIYIDPIQMVKKGEIPWSPELRVEPKNFKIFFVHTPNRTYYLEDPEGYALEWVDAIENVRQKTYGGNKS